MGLNGVQFCDCSGSCVYCDLNFWSSYSPRFGVEVVLNSTNCFLSTWGAYGALLWIIIPSNVHVYAISKLYIYNIQKVFIFLFLFLIWKLCRSKFLMIPNSRTRDSWLVGVINMSHTWCHSLIVPSTDPTSRYIHPRKMTSLRGAMDNLGAGVDNELGGSAPHQCR